MLRFNQGQPIIETLMNPMDIKLFGDWVKPMDWNFFNCIIWENPDSNEVNISTQIRSIWCERIADPIFRRRKLNSFKVVSSKAEDMLAGNCSSVGFGSTF